MMGRWVGSLVEMLRVFGVFLSAMEGSFRLLVVRG